MINKLKKYDHKNHRKIDLFQLCGDLRLPIFAGIRELLNHQM
jgi:hypothetical protein